MGVIHVKSGKAGGRGGAQRRPGGQALAYPRGLEDSSPATQITHLHVSTHSPDSLLVRPRKSEAEASRNSSSTPRLVVFARLVFFTIGEKAQRLMVLATGASAKESDRRWRSLRRTIRN